MGLQYQEEGHKYFLDGVELPSVTTLLTEIGFIDKRWFTEAGAVNGKRRHKATELMDKGVLDWGSVAEVDLPYLKAWAKAKNDLHIRVEEAELLCYHPQLLYAGTIDRTAMIEGSPWIIDIKSGTILRWHNLQLILYGLMVEFNGMKPNLMSVYIQDNGEYKYRVHDYKQKEYALSAVRRWVWINRLK